MLILGFQGSGGSSSLIGVRAAAGGVQRVVDPLRRLEHLAAGQDVVDVPDHRDGEPRLRRVKSGQVKEYAPYRGGMWSMSSKKWVQSPRLAVHLEWLLRELEPKADVIRSLGEPGVLVHGINTRPGKPTILGVCGGKAVIGLPGNPVAVFVTFARVVRPGGRVGSRPARDRGRPRSPGPSRRGHGAGRPSPDRCSGRRR